VSGFPAPGFRNLYPVAVLRLELRLNDHYRADRQHPCEIVDVVVVHRNTSGSPIDVATVEDRNVGAVNPDRAADRSNSAVVADRNHSIIAHRLVANPIDVVGIVQAQEPSEATARILLDDGVNAFGSASVLCVGLWRMVQVAPENGIVFAKESALVIERQLVTLLVHADAPTHRIHHRGVMGLIVENLACRHREGLLRGRDGILFCFLRDRWRNDALF